MFDSGITAESLISQIREEAEISYEVSGESFVRWLNSIEQLLYSEIIKEQKAYSFGLTSPLLKTKINFCPLLEEQTESGAVITQVSPGVYHIEATNKVNYSVSKDLVLEKELTLTAGTYTLSDNVSSRVGQTQVVNPKTNDIYAGLSPMDSASASKTFTLTADTNVVMRIKLMAGNTVGSKGYTVSPQIEAGSTKTAFTPPFDSLIVVPPLVFGFPSVDGEADGRFEDVHAVYVDGRQLIKTTLASGEVFPDAFYKTADGVGVSLLAWPEEVRVVYFVRPTLKTEKNASTETVKVPVEFIDLVTAKLRGEAYKVANEDSLAAKWLNEYNVALETFKAWVADKQSSFGI